MRALFLAILCLFTGLGLYPSNQRDINVKVVDERLGLSHQSVNCFWEDEFGFMWIGTQNGLNRFDGYEVETFLPDNRNPYSILSNNIRQLCGDRNGHLFVRSLQCVESYDMRTERFSVIYEGTTGAMTCMHDSLFIASRNSIYVKPLASHQFSVKYTLPDEEEINHMLIDDVNSEVIVSTLTGKLYFIDLNTGEILNNLQTGFSNNLYLDKKQFLWVNLRDKGLIRMKNRQIMKTYTTSDGLIHDNVRTVSQVNDSLFYIATYGGLQLLNTVKNKFTTYEYVLNDDIYDVRSITSMYLDSNKTLWMGTFYRGLQYYNTANDRYRFWGTSKRNNNILSSNIVSAITEDKNGGIWLGTEGKGVDAFNLKTQISYQSQSDIVKSLFYDPQTDELWIATLFEGVKSLNLHSGVTKNVAPAIYDQSHVKVSSLMNPIKMIASPLNDNRLLLASRNGLVELDKTNNRLYKVDDKTVLGENVSQVWDVYQDNDTLWVITSYKLFLIDLKKQKRNAYTFDYISHRRNKQHFNCILKSRSGDIYLGTTGSGLVRYCKKNHSFVFYGQQEGLEGGFIHGLQQCPLDNHIYIATNIGISRFTEENNRFENFSYRDNWPIFSITPGGFYISNSGTLYVNGRDGLVQIECEQLKQSPVDYQLYIKKIWVDNQIVQPGDSLLMEASPLFQKEMTLPPYTNSVSFAVIASNWNNLSNVEMEYKLEGFDKYFMPVSNHRINYTNLSPGKYRLIVRGKQAGLTGDYPQTTFNLRVLSPIYTRWWFVLSVTVIVGIVIYMLFSLYWGRYILRQKLREEKQEKIRNEELNQKKLRFFTSISHEFRTPLTLIMGQLEMLLMRHDIKPSIYNLLLGSYKSAKRMNALVDEVIDIRKQEQNCLKLQVAEYNLVEILQEICLSFKDYAAHRNIAFQYIPHAETMEAWIDRSQMEKVIYNLISNAMKYTPEGGTVTVDLTGEEEWIVIRVSDTGIGISAEDLPHVFERFWQADANIETGTHGSGIGLALAKGIVEMHEGKIEAASQVGKGTTFTICLKYGCSFSGKQVVVRKKAEVIKEPDILPLQPDGNSKKQEVAQAKILVVEDNSDLQHFLMQIFGSLYEVRAVSNGEEALSIAREWQPDLVLSDIMMPVMSGLELCSKLKTEMATSHIPVVLLTAKNAEEHVVEGLLTGADDYIAKPFNVNILIARCNNIIKERRHLQAIYKKDVESDSSILTANPEDNKLISTAAEIVNKHLADTEFDVQTFARELGVSRTILFSKIKGITGQTPNEYIASLRLKQAASKLQKEPDKSISDIAYECGFSSPSYFIRCFKTNFNETPASFRKQLINRRIQTKQT